MTDKTEGCDCPIYPSCGCPTCGTCVEVQE